MFRLVYALKEHCGTQTVNEKVLNIAETLLPKMFSYLLQKKFSDDTIVEKKIRVTGTTFLCLGAAAVSNVGVPANRTQWERARRIRER